MNIDNHKLYELRINYDNNLENLNKNNVNQNPFKQFELWFELALKLEKNVEVNAMVVSTISEEGFPSSRNVLCKLFNKEGFTFFSNYESKKGKEILNNNKISCLFYWPTLNRQVSINGYVEKVDEKISEEYFNLRPYKSRLSAIISKQSQELLNRKNELENLENKIKEYEENNFEIKKPEYWGGYIVKPIRFEFWQGRKNRFHERVLYTLNENKEWTTKDLYP